MKIEWEKQGAGLKKAFFESMQIYNLRNEKFLKESMLIYLENIEFYWHFYGHFCMVNLNIIGWNWYILHTG